ncbi:unnamed protein product, partial [Symbiodinium sp. KB8]
PPDRRCHEPPRHELLREVSFLDQCSAAAGGDASHLRCRKCRRRRVQSGHAMDAVELPPELPSRSRHSLLRSLPRAL